MTSQDSNNGGSVQYNRWNEENINMNVEGSQSTTMRWDSSTSEDKMQSLNIV